MGIYVNPNNDNLLEAINSSIYVDKSMMLYEILKLVKTDDKLLCISRARRFGKSMAANMLSAYFSKGCDSRHLFEKLKLGSMPGYDRYLNKFNVIKLDVNSLFSSYGPNTDLVPKFTERIRTELKQEFPKIDLQDDDPLEACLGKIFSATREQFVIIMDEYDVLIREQVSKPIFDSYLSFLNSLFKNADLSPAIALAYLTGILPIVRDKLQSKLNLFTEYTMLNSLQLAEFVGFTTDEVQSLCHQYDMDYDECRRWYDGYCINGIEIYSPKSVVSAMKNREYDSYWVKTGSFESLKDYIQMDFDGLREDIKTMLGGGRIAVNTGKYLNTMTAFHSKDEAFTYLLHIGYLAYDRKAKTCYIPNREIADEWVNAIDGNPNYTVTFDLLNDSRMLLQNTLDGNTNAVSTALAKSHEELCNNMNYNNEGAFQPVICLAYYYANAQYTIIKEMPTGKGYADIVLIPYLPDIPAIIIELKRNSSAESAINQIKEKRYFAALEKYHGNLLFVGINYDEKTKQHDCVITRFTK